MDRCDVLIVGGGPAGSSCARGLRESGLESVILDRREFPRDKVCAGWVTPPVLEALALDPALYARERVLQPITGFRVRRIGDAESRVDFERPVSYGIRRCEFDDFLLRRCGARLRLGEGLERLERRAGRWVANGALEARIVVGAGGHFCPVARALFGAGGPAERVVAAQEVEFRLEGRECPIEGPAPEIFFTRDLKGYGWAFRKGDWLNVGLGRQDRRRLSEHVSELLDLLEEEGRLPRGAPARMRGHAYLLYGQAPREVVGEGALLIGDAAGLAHPRSGEGIRPAVESGLLAARAIRAAARARAGEACTQLARYRRDLEARFGRRHPRAPVGLTDLLPASVGHWLAGQLLATPWFARRVVVERWFLQRRRPALRLSQRGPRVALQRKM
ncbi:MAG: NAD(P)/FAD-dependent oxidoreductase [Myxococcota bacterium]